MAATVPAALETSFWTVGHRADVVPYLFDYFEIHVPPGVRSEILAVDIAHPKRVYGYAQWFRVLEARGLLRTAAPARPAGIYGLGESEALALAEEQGWWLLINDARPLAYAYRRGLHVVSVPSFIFLLYEREVLSLLSAKRKLASVAPFTSPEVLDPVQRSVDALARSRGER